MTSTTKSSAPPAASASGGTFSPRLHPRPEYPSTAAVAWNFLDRQVRIPLSTCALLFWVFYPLHRWGVHQFQQAGYDDEGLFLLFGFMAAKIATTVGVHTLFWVCERGLWLEDSRMNRKPSQMPSRKLVIRSVIEMVGSTFVVQPLVFWYLKDHLLRLGMRRYDEPLYGMEDADNFSYSASTFLYAYGVYTVCHLINEVMFYVTHRLLHHPLLYARFHKKHHDYRATVSHASEYAHPLETVLSNVLPTLLGPLLFRVHPCMIGAFMAHKLKRSYEHHSGYALHNTVLEKLWLVDAETSAFHDFHHTINKGNFGCLYVDWFFGTMDHFVAQGGFEGYVKKKEGCNASYLHPNQTAAAEKASKDQ